jgi:predicted DNA-binding protein YlxM (UPF0122 family)
VGGIILSKDMKYIPLMDCYGSLLTEKQQNAMELYYYDDLSLSEIAEHTQTTRQGVHDNIRRAENYLTELEDKLGFVEKSNRLNEVFNSIEVQSKKMLSLSKDNSIDVVNIAEDIYQLVENGKNFLIDL